MLQTLRAQASFGQTGEAAAGPRLISGNGTIVLDLADGESRCVEISSHGWKPEQGVAFAFERRPDTGQLPLPDLLPSDDSLDRLRDLLNIPAGAPWTRTLTWLTAALRPEGPYPILVLRGPCGSGKSTAARMLRSLLDPTRTPLQSLPNTPRQLEKAAAAQRILAIDDIDRIPRAIISSIAKVADETAPVLLILSSHSSPELPAAIARRSLVVELTEPQQLRTLFSLRQSFDALQPHALGALCRAASMALSRFEQCAAQPYPRLADATAWTLAAAPALGLTAPGILAALAAPVHSISATRSTTAPSIPDH